MHPISELKIGRQSGILFALMPSHWPLRVVFIYLNASEHIMKLKSERCSHPSYSQVILEGKCFIIIASQTINGKKDAYRIFFQDPSHLLARLVLLAARECWLRAAPSCANIVGLSLKPFLTISVQIVIGPSRFRHHPTGSNEQRYVSISMMNQHRRCPLIIF